MYQLARSNRKILLTVSAVLVLGVASYFVLPDVFSQASNGSNEKRTLVFTGGASIETTGEIIDPQHQPESVEFDPDKFLREFNYGRVHQLEDGTTVREFTLVARDDQVMEISPGVYFNVWTYNGTVPGPTIRATEGDLVRVNFINNGSKTHTIHFHGKHSGSNDGVIERVGPGGQFTYEFKAEPDGLFLYHCHVRPLEEHQMRGLYGTYIVDPKEGRPPADEMVMVLNGFDTDFDYEENNFYAANTIPFYYENHPIEIEKDKLVRIYVVNILEFDQINNFHLHGDVFRYNPMGSPENEWRVNDIVTLSQGDRGIIEFKYELPGKYMFHAHKIEFTEKGWSGFFKVGKEEMKPDQFES